MSTNEINPILTPKFDRAALNNEVHSRPFIAIKSPTRCTNMAMLHTGGTLEEEWLYIRQLCTHFGEPLSDVPRNHLILNFGSFGLKWERHTEFSSYTFIREGIGQDSFHDTALRNLPKEWFHSMPGEMLVGVHLFVTNCAADKTYDPDQILEVFGSHNIVGAHMSNESASAWTDFKLHGDGFSRILINNISMKERQTGRLLQRLWELESYRMLSLLSMALTPSVGRLTQEIELELAENVGKMTNVYDQKEEQAMLETLTNMAARIEHLSAETSFRFNASKAYYSLVLNRIHNIKETSIEGIQKFSSFIDRRLAPAMRTVSSMDDRITILSKRVNRANNLLQVRINTTLQAQNKELLKSMDRRAKLQLRLQETVEGLSVVAISYYSLGIIKIIANAAEKIFPQISPTIVTAVMAPIIMTLTFLSLRRMKKIIEQKGQEEDL